MAKKKILVVEDSSTALGMIKNALECEGYLVITAETGEEGIKKVIIEKPDLVITDTQLPGIDGFEVCRQIKKMPGSVNPKIIVMTGAIDAVDAIKARESGADDYTVKTSDLRPLIETVKKLI